MRVLVVEDDSKAAGYLANALKESGHNAELAEDGLTGFELARSGDYDVLIVDRMLPHRDGLSLIEGLRQEGIRTPVLILSALSLAANVYTLVTTGVADPLTGLVLPILYLVLLNTRPAREWFRYRRF